jgi:hypothetical protein
MTGKLPLLLAVLAALTTPRKTAVAETAPTVLAHAHNDYEHGRPLRDALEHGFSSVEADIWLVEGRLLVAHDREQAKPERTLQALYLDPLREQARQHGGKILPRAREFILLVDVKSDAESTYAKLREVLSEYKGLLTRFTKDQTVTNAVTIIISGNRARATMEAEPERLAALDGRLPDLETNPSRHLVPLVSDNWRSHFTWTGEGAVPGPDAAKLKRTVQLAREQGRHLRFWATPETPEFWRELQRAGVDVIGTDDLAGLARFLSDR